MAENNATDPGMGETWIQSLSRLLEDGDIKVTFSKWCISGLVPDCCCSRCLRAQGLPVTEETERDAEERSKRESDALRERTVQFLQALKEKDEA